MWQGWVNGIGGVWLIVSAFIRRREQDRGPYKRPDHRYCPLGSGTLGWSESQELAGMDHCDRWGMDDRGRILVSCQLRRKHGK